MSLDDEITGKESAPPPVAAPAPPKPPVEALLNALAGKQKV